MYSCLSVAGNIFSVRAHAVDKLSTKTFFLQKPGLHWKQSPNSDIMQHFETDFFFIPILVLTNNYIVVPSQQSVDWMFDISFSESGTSIYSPTVIYTQTVRKHPISAKIHKFETVYFLISNDVSGICSRYIKAPSDISVLVLRTLSVWQKSAYAQLSRRMN